MIELLHVTTHELKILPQWFEDVISGCKNFEIRKNDRHFEVGDMVLLREWNGTEYTGRGIFKRIKYIYHGTGEYGLQEGYCILGLE